MDEKIGADAVADELLRERKRQVVVEGNSRAGDDGYVRGELVKAGICYLTNALVWVQMLHDGMSKDVLNRKSETAGPPSLWPWAHKWWKPKGPRENLVRAGALIIAEIERLDRAAAAEAADQLAEAE
ncbi:MAG TPA: hypothetical protein PK857_00460 [Hyphomicrobium sp.]|nr:hypothetical protein [Hyphomicrobium sp.]HRO48788.1 hypothetical protein [Hyphomicrobium sp.]